jgi:hypothetical protein
LSNAKVLLRYALSITESIRNDPERYRSLFYNMSPSITDCYSNSSQDYTYSYAYGQIQQSQQYPSSNYTTEANVAIIVDEAEKLYSKVVKDCINKIIIIDYTLSSGDNDHRKRPPVKLVLVKLKTINRNELNIPYIFS